MASLARRPRPFSVGRRVLSRLFQAAAASLPPTPAGYSARSSPPPLLAKLLREPESGVKVVLDLEGEEEAEGSAPRRNRGAPFFEPLLLALQSSSPRKSQLVLEWKLDRLLDADVRERQHFSNLIDLCAKLGNLQFAMRVFTAMESRGIRPNAAVFNSLIHACVSSSNVVHALSLFEIMQRSDDGKPNLATYNAFIAMYSKRGNGKGMLGWYSAAKSAGFSLDVQTYEALINGFTKAGGFEDAGQYFEEMVSSGVIPNVATLECVLEGLCKQKKLGDVKEFLRSLLDGGWEVNERMVEKVLGLYEELRRIEEMKELLKIVQQKLDSSALLSRVYCGMIRMYACLNRLDDVEYSVGRMLKGGLLFTCSRDVEAVISCYFRCEAYERLDLFLERVQGSIELTKSTYDMLLAGYRRVGLHEKLELVKKDMKSCGFA